MAYRHGLRAKEACELEHEGASGRHRRASPEWLLQIAVRWNFWGPRPVYPAPKGTISMDNPTKHEIWIMAAVSMVPIPLLTAIAVFAASH